MNNTVKNFVKAIKSEKKSPSPYDTTAKVVRVDGKTAWVHISGGVDETPVKRTVNAKAGDEVQVRVGGGKAWITGNATAPPTDDTTAIRAQDTANTANQNAETASMAAQSAVNSANTAATAAAQAQTSANQAKASATEAKAQAQEANTQAVYATNYANNALTQLSTVESVVDTLSWISDHSAFVPTTDSTVQANKLYYMPSTNALTLTSETTELNGITYVVDATTGTITANGTATSTGSLFGVGVPDVATGEQLWFTGVSGGSSSTYCLRYSNGPSSVSIYDGIGTATAKSSGNLYLNIYINASQTVNNLVFTPRVTKVGDDYNFEIVTPTGDPSSQGLYELSTDEAVKTYVQSHLALTNDGLYILNDSSAYKMLLANDGMYIQAPNGQSVNQVTAVGNIIRATDGTEIAHLGYGEGQDYSGTTSTAPYYDIGQRETNTTIGNYSVAEGKRTTASGYGSHAEGIGVNPPDAGPVASGRGSHAEGVGTTASSTAAHSEGMSTTASGLNSHAEGNNTVASGNYSHSQNLGTIASQEAQTAIGKYNTNTLAAFIVGNGTADNARSNAFAVSWNGDVSASGDMNIPSGCNYMINGVPISGGGGGVTGVKGNAESTYRTGNVNITPANLGISQDYTFVSSLTPSVDARGVSAWGANVTPTDTTQMTAENLLKVRPYLVNGSTIYPLIVTYFATSSTKFTMWLKSIYTSVQQTTSSTVSGTLYIVAPFEISSVTQAM